MTDLGTGGGKRQVWDSERECDLAFQSDRRLRKKSYIK